MGDPKDRAGNTLPYYSDVPHIRREADVGCGAADLCDHGDDFFSSAKGNLGWKDYPQVKQRAPFKLK